MWRQATAGILALLALGMALMPGIAAAGSNGQQIIVYGRAQYSVTICGTNQNSSYVCGHGNTPGYYTVLRWLVVEGNRDVYSYGASGNYIGTSYCSVPVSQSKNWTYCHGVD